MCYLDNNEGAILWLQQFWAMFVKRIYYSIRFYPYIPIQVGFPTVFSAIGVLVVILNPQSDDPPRPLYLHNTGLDARNTTIFYAELDGLKMNFSVRDHYIVFKVF